MVKKLINFKTLSVMLSIGAMASLASIQKDNSEKKLNLSAITTAVSNVKYVSTSGDKKINKSDVESPNVTDSIIKTIEKDLRSQFKKQRVTIAKAITSVKYAKEISKNWNDIKPEFSSMKENDNQKINTIESTSEINNESSLEINNKEIISLYGIAVEEFAIIKFENLNIENVRIAENENGNLEEANTKNEYSNKDVKVEQLEPSLSSNFSPDMATDVVSTQQSSEKANVENDEDLVVYDYPVKNDNSKKMFNQPISSSVKEAIEREVHKETIVAGSIKSPSRKLGFKKVDNNFQQNSDHEVSEASEAKFEYSVKDVEKNNNEESKQAISTVAASFASPSEDLGTQVQFKIKAVDVNMSTQKISQAVGFEFVPDYDRSNRQDDLASGEIDLTYYLNNQMNTQTGVIQSQGNIPTRVELNLNEGEILIPLISEVGIQKYLEKNKMNIVGNLILVSIDNTIIDVEIDSEYQEKILLNSKFGKVTKKENASYIMLLGVKTGNSLLRYLLANNETAQKIIFVGDGELYYEDPSFETLSREIYNLTTRTLLGKKVKELNIPEEKISLYGSQNQTKKRAINSYEIKLPTTVNNSRKYIEFKHLNQKLYVGTSGENKLEIPGNDFINKVLEVSDLKDLGQRCMVQMNLSKEIRDVKIGGKNTSGEMFIENSYLDSDGNFNLDSSEMAEKIFISGDQEGLLSAKIEYVDGSVDFLKTFCSEGSYLVEQL